MAIQDNFPRRWRWNRWSTGLANSQYLKNVYSTSFGYTSAKKKVSAGTATALLAATAAPTSGANTVVTVVPNPDVPRALVVTPSGTAANILGTPIVVTGTNSEGKVITENFFPTAGATTAINGAKAFMTVTTMSIPAQAGSGVLFALGTQNKLGVYHRLWPNNTTVKVIQSTIIGPTNVTSAPPTFQTAPTVVADLSILENNLVTPATAPDGTTFLHIVYQYDNWLLGALNDGTSRGGFLYHTSTSTSSTSSSTSTTTGTTTSTSTSSTSTSSTSISTSSTSISTSSTSTSTTTVP